MFIAGKSKNFIFTAKYPEWEAALKGKIG